MITRTEPLCQDLPRQTESWQQSLANVIRDPQQLFELLELDLSKLPPAIAAAQDFPLKVPRGFAAKMEKGNWHDPLLRQVLPLDQELDYQPGFTKDPLEETTSNPCPGLIHKYHGRVLLIVSGGCAINCRYCFRRHFPYQDNNPSRAQWQQSLQYIADDPSIKEVILSGGDPLVASDRQLAELVEQIADIPHVSRLRVHSRLPIVIPQRITDDCLAWLTGSRLQAVMVIHCNHPNELDSEVGTALEKMANAGVTLLNQSVLLGGINDNLAALIALSETLHRYRVLPYYLHLLDRVKGAAHFDTDENQAKQLISQMMTHLPGYLVPKLVREVSNQRSKVPIPIVL
jgi:EF-P beta-lysylation protein EpmB